MALRKSSERLEKAMKTARLLQQMLSEIWGLITTTYNVHAHSVCYKSNFPPFTRIRLAVIVMHLCVRVRRSAEVLIPGMLSFGAHSS